MHGMHRPRPVTTTDGRSESRRHAGTPDRDRRPWLLMVVLSVAQFMVILDATVVNVALPSIARSLSFPAGGLQWVVTAYVLASGGLVLLGGRAADVAGRRRTFLAGLALFTAASLASGIAPAAGALIAARAGQGLGAALLTPAALSIITTSYAGAQRATALGVWGAIGGAGAAAGVLAGGMLDDVAGWRSVFLVNVPVGVVAGLLSLHLVPRHEAAAPRRPRARPARRGAGGGGAGDGRLHARGRSRARLGIGPDPAAAGPGPGPAGRVRRGRAVGAAAAGARAAVASPLAGRRGAGHVRRHRDPGRHVLPELAVPAGGAARVAAAGGPGVPPARPGDRGGRPPRLAAAAAGRVTGADRRGPGRDGRGSAPADRRVRPFGLPDRLPAWPARGGDRHRPGVPGHRRHRDERHRRRSGRDLPRA